MLWGHGPTQVPRERGWQRALEVGGAQWAAVFWCGQWSWKTVSKFIKPYFCFLHLHYILPKKKKTGLKKTQNQVLTTLFSGHWGFLSVCSALHRLTATPNQERAPSGQEAVWWWPEHWWLRSSCYDNKAFQETRNHLFEIMSDLFSRLIFADKWSTNPGQQGGDWIPRSQAALMGIQQGQEP